MKSLVFFNNKGGVGKTTLTFNLAHMFARLGRRTAVLDYDPQCNLSSIFLDEDDLVEIWESSDNGRTVFDCVDRVRRGKGDLREPNLTEVAENLWLLPGHLDLSKFEQPLAEEWPKTSSSQNERALDVTTSLHALAELVASGVEADLVMLDVGPSLGALNRAALLGCDAVLLPLAPDLFSLQGLKNVGPTLRDWRLDWRTVRERHLTGRTQDALPHHDFQPIGYLVQQHLARVDRPVRAYARWAEKIPSVYHEYVLDSSTTLRDFTRDRECIGMVKHFASLVPYAQTARKPLFDLKQADGVGGGQIQAVASCRKQFAELATKILERLDRQPNLMP